MRVELFGLEKEVEVIEDSKHIDEETGYEAYETTTGEIVAFDEAIATWVQLAPSKN